MIPSEILENVQKIPLLSPSSLKLVNMMGDTGHTLRQVTEIIEVDPALTARVLTVVNSAWFSLREQVSSVGHAITLLGDKMIVSIALALSTSKLYNVPLIGYESRQGEFWKHSLRTAIAARELAHYTNGAVNPDEAYTGGLLHDIGKSVISDFIVDGAAGITERLVDSSFNDFLDAEQSIAGSDHTDVGMEMAKHWNLPEVLQEIIKYHHNPSCANDRYKPIVYVVHLGDMSAMMRGSGTGYDTMRYEIDQNYPLYINISQEELEKVLMRVIMEFEKTQGIIFGDS